MKRHELEKRLQKLGWMLDRHGRRHDIWTNGDFEIAVHGITKLTNLPLKPFLGKPRRRMMHLSGQVFKVGKYWAIEVPILSIVTQGRTKKEAYEMMGDAIESLVNKNGFKVDIFPGKGHYFEVGSPDLATLTAFLLRRQRLKRGLTLIEVSKRLGAKSHNAYARYEQGKTIPTIEKFSQLLSALSPDNDFVLVESQSN